MEASPSMLSSATVPRNTTHACTFSFNQSLPNLAWNLTFYLYINNMLHVILQRLLISQGWKRVCFFDNGNAPCHPSWGPSPQVWMSMVRPHISRTFPHTHVPLFAFPTWRFFFLFFLNTSNKQWGRCTIPITVTWETGIITIGDSQEMASFSITSFLVH